jgi:hypothetical protein
MARAIVIRLGGEESAFAFSKVEREKLYGRKQRIVVDENGRTCQPAWLTADGTALVPNGGTAHVWVDDQWNAVEQDGRMAVDEAGTPLELRPSTLGIAQDAREVEARRVLDCVALAVYELAPENLSPAVAAALSSGKFLEIPFRYRDAYDDEALFLLQNDDGYFALVARPTGFEMLEREAIPLAVGPGVEGDDIDDDLDFSML